MRELSDTSAKVIFFTYSAEGEKTISGVTRDSGIYKVVFQLSDGKWIHVGTVEPTQSVLSDTYEVNSRLFIF